MRINDELYSLEWIDISDLIKSRYINEINLQNGIPGITLRSHNQQFFIWFNVKSRNDVFMRNFNVEKLEWEEWKQIDYNGKLWEEVGILLGNFGDYLKGIKYDTKSSKTNTY